MLCFPYQRDAKSFRFPQPDLEIPFQVPGLSPCWPIKRMADDLECHRSYPGRAGAARPHHTGPDPGQYQRKFFSLPDEVFHLDLGCAAIAIYAFLLYRENRKTYQCTLSYKTIGQAIGASNNTVRKYVLELEAVRAHRH